MGRINIMYKLIFFLFNLCFNLLIISVPHLKANNVPALSTLAVAPLSSIMIEISEGEFIKLGGTPPWWQWLTSQQSNSTSYRFNLKTINNLKARNQTEFEWLINLLEKVYNQKNPLMQHMHGQSSRSRTRARTIANNERITITAKLFRLQARQQQAGLQGTDITEQWDKLTQGFSSKHNFTYDGNDLNQLSNQYPDWVINTLDALSNKSMDHKRMTRTLLAIIAENTAQTPTSTIAEDTTTSGQKSSPSNSNLAIPMDDIAFELALLNLQQVLQAEWHTYEKQMDILSIITQFQSASDAQLQQLSDRNLYPLGPQTLKDIYELYILPPYLASIMPSRPETHIGAINPTLIGEIQKVAHDILTRANYNDQSKPPGRKLRDNFHLKKYHYRSKSSYSGAAENAHATPTGPPTLPVLNADILAILYTAYQQFESDFSTSSLNETLSTLIENEWISINSKSLYISWQTPLIDSSLPQGGLAFLVDVFKTVDAHYRRIRSDNKKNEDYIVLRSLRINLVQILGFIGENNESLKDEAHQQLLAIQKTAQTNATDHIEESFEQTVSDTRTRANSKLMAIGTKLASTTKRATTKLTKDLLDNLSSTLYSL